MQKVFSGHNPQEIIIKMDAMTMAEIRQCFWLFACNLEKWENEKVNDNEE